VALSARLAAVVDALPLRPDALDGRYPAAGQKAFARIAACSRRAAAVRRRPRGRPAL